MSDKQFVHLHLHTDYSLLDGAIQIKPLAERLQELNMPACAITDHGNIFGAISFYKEMKKAGIKPIIGCEVYFAPNGRTDRTPAKRGEKPYNHMILLARNRTGYHNLVRLTSKAYKEGIYYKPRIDKELLSQYGEGIIGLSACLSGLPQYHLMRDRFDEAAKSALEFQDILGKGNYFLEIQDHKLADQQKIEKQLIELSKKIEIPLVATNDAHYLTKDDAFAHDVMLCIGQSKTITQTDRMKFGGPEFYVRTAEEMHEIFRETPDALRRTLDIAEMIHTDLPLGENQLPVFPIPASEGNLSIDEYFDKVVREGFAKRKTTVWERHHATGKLKYPHEEYEKRITREIEIIQQMGFPSYFLIVWDFIKYAKENDIPVGPGRGSAAGSLVAYCLEITDIDPIQYELLFERFLNPDRVTMPDIDIDFCVHGRPKVIEHVSNLYGRDSVCQIITFGTLASKAAIKDVGRALEMPYAEVDKIAKLIPPPVRGRNVSLSQALEQVAELRDLRDNNEQVAKILEVAQRLEGCARHSSVHAAGVVISPKPLDELIPVAVSSKSELTTQYEMMDLEETGMLKMDFLGLTTLTIINECLKSIKDTLDKEIDWSEVSLDDEASYKIFADGRTEAIFQFESSGMAEICRRLKPRTIEDISALNALYRPGPLDSGMIDDFIERHHGRAPIEYIVPEMEEYLGNTQGIMVYQEQIMQLAQKLAGYSLGEADLMRRAMGKKDKDKMAVHEQKFITGATKNSIPKKKATEIFRLMANFADYGFNRSHSVAYAYVAFQTAYLKAHYPAHFYAAVLTNEADNTDKVLKYSAEAKSQDIAVLPPDVNESNSGFTPVGGDIRFGLAAIKGIGQSAVQAILEARAEQPFISLFDLTARISQKGLNKRVLESLVTAGAFDSLKLQATKLHEWRACLHASIDRALERGARKGRERSLGYVNMFDLLGGGNDEDGSDAVEMELSQVKAWTHIELLAHEKASVGFYLSGHPLENYIGTMESLQLHLVRQLPETSHGAKVSLGGLVADYQQKYTKRGAAFSMFRLEDIEGAGVKCLMWSEAHGKYNSVVKGADAMVYLTGRLENNGEGSLSVMIEEAYPLAEAGARAAKAIVVAVCAEDFWQEKTLSEMQARLKNIEDLMSRSPGSCAVYFDIELRELGHVVRLNTKPACWVKPNAQLERALKELGCEVRWLATGSPQDTLGTSVKHPESFSYLRAM